MDLKLINDSGAAATVAGSDALFGRDHNEALIHQVVTAYQANARQGTRAQKARGDVNKSHKKPWRQKGTGRARAGTTRAPQWTGGGVAFPPMMRDFSVKVNRKQRKAAFRAALSAHAGEGSLALLDTTGWEEPSTKRAAALLETWGQQRPLVLVVDDEDVVARSFRNLPRVAVTGPHEVEVAALVWARSVLVSEKALETVVRRAS